MNLSETHHAVVLTFEGSLYQQPPYGADHVDFVESPGKPADLDLNIFKSTSITRVWHLHNTSYWLSASFETDVKDFRATTRPHLFIQPSPVEAQASNGEC